MQVWYSLARGGTVIENKAETGLAHAKALRHFSGFEQQMAEDFVIFGRSLSDSRNWFLGNNQNVGRRLWLNISKGQYQVVFINNCRRDLARDDLFE